MGPRRLLLAGVLAAVVAVGTLADRALSARAEAEVRTDALDAKESASFVARRLEEELGRIERSVEEEPLVAFQRVAAQPETRPGFGQGLESMDDVEVRQLLDSRDATPSGLPVAVVAAATLREERSMRLVAERLLSGELPVRAEDVVTLAASLGAGDDPRVEALASRIARTPAREEIPELPRFLRRRAGKAGSVAVEGWARAEEGSVSYRVTVAELLRLAGSDELARRTRAVTGEVGGARAAVPSVAGLVLEVQPRQRGGPGLAPLRLLLWGAVGLGLAAVFALDRAVSRERGAAERERALLGAVTHELRTPLASIRMLAETLEDGRGEPAAYGALVRGECERLEAMVEQVLAASRATDAPRLGPVDPEEIVRGVASLAAPRAERRSVAMALVLGERLPRATWDADAVRRALLNLVENAIKHGREGGRVEIGAVATGARVELRVSDDGPGIKRKDRARIFGRFERGETDAPGTGLGLYLVEKVARAHGGSVRVESVPDRGATFTLVLPVSPPVPGASPA